MEKQATSEHLEPRAHGEERVPEILRISRMVQTATPCADNLTGSLFWGDTGDDFCV